jgi:hypothetical protein
VGLNDLLSFFSKYGLAGVVIAILLFAVGVMYLQQLKTLKEATARADRFEAEIKALNEELQRYLTLGFAVRSVMGEAAKEMRKLE